MAYPRSPDRTVQIIVQDARRSGHFRVLSGLKFLSEGEMARPWQVTFIDCNEGFFSGL